MKKLTGKEAVLRFLSGRYGVVCKDDALYLKNVEQSAVISFNGDDMHIDLCELHPKKTSGKVVLKHPNFFEAVDAANGIYTQIYCLS